MTQIQPYPITSLSMSSVPLVPDEGVQTGTTGFLALMQALAAGESSAAESVPEVYPLSLPPESRLPFATPAPARPDPEAAPAGAETPDVLTDPAIGSAYLPLASRWLGAHGDIVATAEDQTGIPEPAAELPVPDPADLAAGVMTLIANAQATPLLAGEVLITTTPAAGGVRLIPPLTSAGAASAPEPTISPPVDQGSVPELAGASQTHDAPVVRAPDATPSGRPALAALPLSTAPPAVEPQVLTDARITLPASLAAEGAAPDSLPVLPVGPAIPASADAPLPLGAETTVAPGASPRASDIVAGVSAPDVSLGFPVVVTGRQVIAAAPEAVSPGAAPTAALPREAGGLQAALPIVPASDMAPGERAARFRWHGSTGEDAVVSNGAPSRPVAVAGMVLPPQKAVAGIGTPDNLPESAPITPRDQTVLLAPKTHEGLSPASDQSNPIQSAPSSLRTDIAVSAGPPGSAMPVLAFGVSPPLGSLRAEAIRSDAPTPAPAPSVSVQITQALSAGGPVTELRLAPEELGQVRIDMRQDGDRLVMTVSAERQDTLDLLRRHAGELAADLRAAGHSGLDLSFGRWSGPGADPGTDQQPSGQALAGAGAETAPVQPAALTAAAQPFLPESGLYLRI